MGVVTKNIDAQNNIEKTIEKMYAEDMKIVNCANVIKHEIQETMNRLSDFSIKGTILLFSDGSIDGHGILVDGEAYVFFDLNAIARGIATHFTSKKTAEPVEDIYWLGYLNKREVDIWMDKCENLFGVISVKPVESGVFSDFISRKIYRKRIQKRSTK